VTDVARVAVESPLPHLDRLFDFAIPEELEAAATPGCRVRVRLRGRKVSGWLIERGPGTFDGTLQPLLDVLGPPVLTAEVADLCRLVADRYAGTLADVVRFAVPPRVKAIEGREYDVPDLPAPPDLSQWAGYPLPMTGAASWICHPHDDPFAMLAALALDTAARGQSAVLVMPDAADVAQLRQLLPGPAVAVLSGELSNRVRYGTHLQILSGAKPIVIGTRSAVFAPVPDLGLIAVWDDGDDVLAEPHTPGWHAREVAALRAWQTGARVIVGGYTRTAATAQWIADGRAADVRLDRADSRRRRYRVDALHEPDADRRRIPRPAFAMLRAAVESGVALVQVPRVGGAQGLICADCGHVLRCPRCGGGVRPDRQGQPRCRLCHTAFTTCPCGGAEFVAVGAGSRRSAEELQKAFPAVPVIRSDAESGVLPSVDIAHGIVVATPGAEPRIPGGYAGLLILDTEVLLALPSLRAREEAVRRWTAAIARSAPDASTLIVAPQDLPVVQALVRNDLAAFARQERDERAAAHMPPAYRCVRLKGEAAALNAWLDGFDGDVLGPLETTTSATALLIAALPGTAMLRQVRTIQAARSKSGDPVVEVRVDPVDLGLG
jgi:primosomal protein N' (replication factor Y)